MQLWKEVVVTDSWVPDDERVSPISDDGARLTHQIMNEDFFNIIVVEAPVIHLINADQQRHACIS